MNLFIKKRKFPFIISFLVFFIVPIVSFGADTGYTLLSPLDNKFKDSAINGNIADYLQYVFNLGIGIAIGLSVVMIVIGGAQYLSTDAIQGKEEGKQKLWGALWGLILALSTYLILSTINPDILKLNLNIKNLTQGEGIPGGLGTQETRTYSSADQDKLNRILADELRVRTEIVNLNKYIDINNGGLGRGWCTSLSQKSGCTNVGLLPSSAINGIDKIQRGCGCAIMITGGTEWWIHSQGTSHNIGSPVVDLRNDPALRKYIADKMGVPNLEIGKTYTVNISPGPGGSAHFFYEDAKHFHVTIF